MHPVRTTALATALFAALLATPADAQRQTAQSARQQKYAEIPVCAKPLGTISVLEPENGTDWWSGQQLQSPTALIKLYVNKSRCFTLVDRGAGFDAARRERDLAADGELRNRSNIGKGQVRAADYVLVPDLISRNSNSGGNAIGGIIGGLDFRKKTADVMLTVTDVRSSEQVAMAEGHSTKTDIGWGAGGGLFTGSGWGGAGASGYANTEIGQVIALAYLEAYIAVVDQLGGLPDNASAANVQQAVRVTKPARLFTTPQGTKVVRSLDPGMMLYPTGNKQGMMWEVEDELGNKGWISSTLVELAR